jgi:hypothetical protein
MSFTNFAFMRRAFLQHDGLPFADLLPEATIQQIHRDAGLPTPEEQANAGIVYTTAVTLWAFLSQVLHAKEQRSCAAAVARVIVLCVALGREPCSDDTGVYCRARARLPLALIQRATYHVAEQAESQVPEAWLWKGLHVHLLDGTTVSTPDTISLQAKFPQSSSQKPGLGFPIIRMVVLLSLTTAMIQGMAMGPYAGKETGETALFRQILDRLKPGDVVLADRYFCSYFMIALLIELGVHVVFRLHHLRRRTFQQGRDHVIIWLRPQRPDWMDQETYERMPRSIRVREVHVQVNEPGFRVQSLILATTLTDADAYSSDDLAELYHQRWLVELDIRTLKITLGMDVLRCKSPDMVTKEIWTCLLAYNLIRQRILQAALLAELSPRQISFTAAMQKIAASWQAILLCDEERVRTLIETHLRDLATHRIGDRPDRAEPRAIKRRPKPHPLLTRPRAQAKAELNTPAAA